MMMHKKAHVTPLITVITGYGNFTAAMSKFGLPLPAIAIVGSRTYSNTMQFHSAEKTTSLAILINSTEKIAVATRNMCGDDGISDAFSGASTRQLRTLFIHKMHILIAVVSSRFFEFICWLNNEIVNLLSNGCWRKEFFFDGAENSG